MPKSAAPAKAKVLTQSAGKPPAAAAQVAQKDPLGMPDEGRRHAVVDAVLPAVDGGRFPVKCVAGEALAVEAHCFTDGHEMIRVVLQWRSEDEPQPREIPMVLLHNDIWQASFTPPKPGRYYYTVAAWVDNFSSWRHELMRRVDEADIRIALRLGAVALDGAADRAAGEDCIALHRLARKLESSAMDTGLDAAELKTLALDDALAELAGRYPDRRFETRHAVQLPLVADRLRARFSSWYELFPRSAGTAPGVHGTFADVQARLPAIAAMGFDVLYFPPIHPIGRIQRKGKNNTLVAQPDDVGSPWAIGSDEGGHKSILPQLGTLADFKGLVGAAQENGLEIALDIAFQCAPDHPYVKEHPGWFRWRPDGTVQYAENPPKKYQDIYPFNFECEDWRGLWAELRSVFVYWIEQGVRIFRVDNPHTKAFPFWEWVISSIKHDHADVIFLAEAFTRPKVMHRLAKLGYSQSYTYFTWRNTKAELVDYFNELANGPGSNYFRPNVWPNTPDILHAQLQNGQAAMFRARLALAATLSSSYGIYGPAYELLEHLPRGAGSEEYLDSEKYQLRTWDHDRPESLAPFVARINKIRKENAALHDNESLRFLPIDNDQLLAFTKQSPDGKNVILTIINLDPDNAQSGWVGVLPESLGVDAQTPFQVYDLLSDQHFTWRGEYNYVLLDPRHTTAHVFLVSR